MKRTQDVITATKRRKSCLFGFLCGCIFVLVFTQQQQHVQLISFLSAKAQVEAISPHSKSRQWNHSVVREHPHAGARDENGAWHYVPDVGAIRRMVLERIQNDPDSSDRNHYLPLESNSNVCQETPGEGFEQPDGYKVLREYVELDGPDPLPEEKAPVPEADSDTREGSLLRHRTAPASTGSRSDVPPPRILCGVYSHKGSHERIAGIADTWGWRCDGFFAASTETDRSIGAIDLPHQGPESYDNMWQKTRSMVAFMYDYYLEDYDYFLLSGDDTFIILENLRNYLLSLESETGGRDAQPLSIGMPISNWKVNYNTGGPSYILNRSALRRLVEQGLPYYFTDTERPCEDILMGAMMAAIHVHLVDTSDAANRQRFFHDGLHLIGSDTHLWMYDALVYDHGSRRGRNLVSTQSIGFHKITSMQRFSAILYNACPMGTVLGDAQKSTLQRSGQTIV
jgi:hypothetical protein